MNRTIFYSLVLLCSVKLESVSFHEIAYPMVAARAQLIKTYCTSKPESRCLCPRIRVRHNKCVQGDPNHCSLNNPNQNQASNLKPEAEHVEPQSSQRKTFVCKGYPTIVYPSYSSGPVRPHKPEF
ncbi:MAG TPA: hypothetical protein VHA52_12205, partial [Candidatus Babeliaceae bacterium]|nr:hypothetical protein [Candidatus Babeliaceae bacterium]